jgi:1-acyl-sn-glycerol-3-phosphate acyltransferase
MLLITWHAGINTKFLGKKELFSFPFGAVARLAGGIPVDRGNPHALISELVGRVNSGEEFFLMVAPEGTRGRAKFWKSGFYRLAIETGLPISLGFIDRATKTAGFGPTFHATGNVRADMAIVRGFYSDKGGLRPLNKTEPRLRNE